MADPRKTADLVLGLSAEGAAEGEGPPPGGGGPGEMPVDATMEAKRSAASDAMTAFKTGDVDGLEAALSAFVTACTGGGAHDEEG